MEYSLNDFTTDGVELIIIAFFTKSKIIYNVVRSNTNNLIPILTKTSTVQLSNIFTAQRTNHLAQNPHSQPNRNSRNHAHFEFPKARNSQSWIRKLIHRRNNESSAPAPRTHASGVHIIVRRGAPIAAVYTTHEQAANCAWRPKGNWALRACRLAIVSPLGCGEEGKLLVVK